MSISFLLLGKTNVVIQVHTEPPPELPVQGVLGAIDSLVETFSTNPFSDEPEGILTLDVSVREGHTRQSTVTTDPVEEGADVTDHIIGKPKMVTIDGTITDTPSGIAALLVVPGLIDRFASLPRSIEAFNQLESWNSEKQLLDVITALTVYSKVAITMLNVPRDVTTGRALKFSIQFKEIIQVSSSVGGTTSASEMLGTGGTADLGAVSP